MSISLFSSNYWPPYASGWFLLSFSIFIDLFIFPDSSVPLFFATFLFVGIFELRRKGKNDRHVTEAKSDIYLPRLL